MLQTLAHPGAADALVTGHNRAGILDCETGITPDPLQQCKITGTITPETKIITYHKVPDLQSVNQDVVDKTHARILSKLLIERDAQHHVDPKSCERFKFLAEFHQTRRCLTALKKFPGLRFKNHYNAWQLKLL